MRRDPAIALRIAALGVLALALVAVVALHTGPGRALDQEISDGFVGLYSWRVNHRLLWIPHLSDPPPFLIWFVVIVGTALVHRRPLRAVTVAGILLLSSVTTALLKPLLPIARETLREPVGPMAFPSGHATASMAVALCAILVAPATRRPLVAALGAAYTLAVTFTLLVASWHFPSDVLAGYLVAGTWTALGVAVLWRHEPRPAPDEAIGAPSLREALKPVAAVVAGAALVTVLVALARPDDVVDYAREHKTFIVGAGGIAALALVLVGLLTAAAPGTRRREARR